jgi:Transposase DDE domain
LLALAVERKVLRSRRLRVDTTVVEADIRGPTDSGLCAHAVSRLTRLGKRIEAAGLGPRSRLRDRRRSVGKRVRAISAAHAPPRSSATATGNAATARNGLEGRISQLKRKGLRRTRLRSLAGAQTWVGGITLAHNLQRMALLAPRLPILVGVQLPEAADGEQELLGVDAGADRSGALVGCE